jgi:hypothetical protein
MFDTVLLIAIWVKNRLFEILQLWFNTLNLKLNVEQNTVVYDVGKE